MNNWKAVKIQDVCRVASGATPKTLEPSYWNGDIPWVTPMDLSKLNSKYVDQGERSISDSGLKSCSAELIPERSLIMSSRAPIGYFAINTKQATTNQGCKTFICEDSVDVEFLYYYLNHHIDEIKRLGSGSTFAEVGKKHLENLIIRLPSMSLQKKTGLILDTIDKLIAKTDQIIQKFHLLKIGIADQLLSRGIGHQNFQKTKIGNIPSTWTALKLGELCNFTTGKLNSNQAVENGKFPFFTCAQETFAIDRYSFDCEAVLLAGNNASGVYSVKYYKGKFDAYQRTYVITIKNPQIFDYHYLKELLNLKLNMLKDFSVGTNTKFLTIKLLLSIQVLVPPIDEQRKIASILLSIDKKIISEEARLHELNQLKKGLMNDIFSGKVEVN